MPFGGRPAGLPSRLFGSKTSAADRRDRARIAYVEINGTLFFTANDGIDGDELWKSDGTPAGTILVREINTGSGSASPQHLTNVNGTLFFTASESVNGRELQKSDGTPAGTVVVFVRNPDRYAVLDTRLLSHSDGLSPAGSGLAAALDRGSTLREVAEERAASITTVRSQSYALTAKLGVNRQVDLIRVFANYR